MNFEEVKKIPIADVLTRWGVTFEKNKSGAGFHADCPLPQHRTEKRSFGFVPAGNYWQCFSPQCKEARGGAKGGNVISLVMAHEQISDYRKAAELLWSWFAPSAPADPPESPEGEVVEEAPAVEPEKPKRFISEELDRRLDVLLDFPDGTLFGEWRERVKKQFKFMMLENYRNGKRDGKAEALKEVKT